VEELLKRIEGNTQESEEKKNVFLSNLGLDSKIQTSKVIEMGGFQLRRLDVLDKLNQDAYINLQK